MQRMSLTIDGKAIPYVTRPLDRLGTVCICTVAAGSPSWPYLNSIFQLKAPGTKMFRQVGAREGVDQAHNRLIQWFLEETAYDWILSVDSDAVLHPDTLLRLLSWEKSFVSALAFKRSPPFPPVVYTEPQGDEVDCRRPIQDILRWIGSHPQLLELRRLVVIEPRPDDALFEVIRGGAHCLLTHRSVLEGIDPPWFMREGEGAEEGYGSDFAFYRKARDAGFTTYVDLSVVAGHLTGGLCIGALDFLVWSNTGIWSADGNSLDITMALPGKEA